MIPETISEKIKSMKWEKWLERPFHAFVFSLFEDSSRQESFEKIGIFGVELRAQFSQKGIWYFNQYFFDEMDRQVEEYLKNHNMGDVSDGLEEFRKTSKQKFEFLANSSVSVEEKFSVVVEILKLACTYIWLAHGIESYFSRRIKEEVPKYIEEDLDKFVGDASFPEKKNAHAKLDEMMRSEANDAEIAQRYGWLKSRDGFSAPFTVEDIGKMRAELSPEQERVKVQVPIELDNLFRELRELVFFRTERTDVFYELFFLSRPIIIEMAKKYNIGFDEMRYFRAKSFLDGKPERYDPFMTFVYLDGNTYFQNEPIIDDQKILDRAIKGAIAYKGKKQGIVKIVKDVTELDKVLSGEILVTQMTFPSFISAMNRAAAFVTDEGGITCHAAIVAREMHKPCIVGTKIATQVLKDGDLVEVDAEKGTVNILQRIN